ncbi:4Fe-4S binding protein [Paludibacter sp.]|uniref:4Fe-4S binding protein n=1 Tax=Paludibacter sp. TaxID=1898105 RepID=UPI0013543A5F|nr:4Fe-4S binding protein [Paludibacter sp.]MTK52399.1 4Fe-4S binding protein [Paludibacter sp.]
MKWLKWIRVILAIVLTIPVFLLFIDFFHLLPHDAAKLAHLQLVPALLGGFWGAALFVVLLTLIFGRLYCSVICPAGVLQDVFNRLTSRGVKKNRAKRYFKYTKPNNWLRYSILVLTVVAFAVGSSFLVILLDPYSNIGRMMTDLVRPALIPLNNLMVPANASDNNFFHHINSLGFALVPVAIATLFLITIAVMSLWRGRLYCNTICPVGTFLGLFSRFAPFKVVVDHSACNHCGVCARSCKSQCIDSKNSAIDHSRCVDCFNCLSTCSQSALSYRFQLPAKKADTVSDTVKNSSRRNFLIAGATAVATAPVAIAQNKLGVKKAEPIMPPGAGTRDNFNTKCTACHLCVSECPTQVLHPTAFDYGIMGMMQPKMAFNKGFCQPDCTHCSNVCPSGALVPLTREQKHITQVGIAHFTQTSCIVYKEHTDCGACSEHCPTQAVSMVAYVDGLRIPHVEDAICVGCGGCEYICPATPKAIVVHANIDQKIAKPIPKGEAKEQKIESFGF